MKKIYWVLFPLLLVGVLVAGYFYMGYAKKSPGGIEKSISSNHPGFKGMRIEDEKAWEELIRSSELNKVQVIYKGIDDAVIIDSPIQKVDLTITDQEQPYFRIGEGDIIYSSADVSFSDGILFVKMYINENYTEDELLETLVHNTIWNITQAYHNQNIQRSDEYIQKLQASQKHFKDNNLQLVTTR